MIVYLDSAVLARAHLADEAGHDEAVHLLEQADIALMTGTWSRVEVSGALVRASRSGRVDVDGLLSVLDADLSGDGPVTVVVADQQDVETMALSLVREHAPRAMDA